MPRMYTNRGATRLSVVTSSEASLRRSQILRDLLAMQAQAAESPATTRTCFGSRRTRTEASTSPGPSIQQIWLKLLRPEVLILLH